MDKSRLLKVALDLVGQADENSFELSRCLAHLHGDDPELIPEFVKRSGLDWRKTHYLIQIGKSFSKVRRTKRLAALGWTKLQIIGRHVERHELGDLITLAETSTAHELKRKLAGAGEAAPNCVQLYFTPAQYQVFEKAVLANGGKKVRRGLADKEQALISALQVAKSS